MRAAHKITLINYHLKQQCRFFLFLKNYELSAVSGTPITSGTERNEYLLTVRCRYGSLFVGLQTPRKRCLFSYSSGAFIPQQPSTIKNRVEKKKELDYVRSLKHKQKKLFRKKVRILR